MSQQIPYQPQRRGVPPGTRLNGIYEIDEIIGAGGMGEIYKSHEIQTGAAIAIKMLLPDVADNEISLALFRREAAALHNLPHDAIVRYFLFTVEPVLQRPYLAMEFVDGLSLSDMLQNGPLPFEQFVSLTRRIASGLQAAHERGIIHRDVSPDNIIVPRSDMTKAKIIDFGIARSTQLGDPTIIGSGFAGKQNYVSPEQVGLYGGDITPKSDIYSLGLVLHYAATGQKLDMGGSQFDLVEKRRRVPDLDAIDPRIAPLLRRMLEPDPAGRLRSMDEVAAYAFAPAAPAAAPPASAKGATKLPGVKRPATKAIQPSSSSTFGTSKLWLTLAGAAVLIGAGIALYLSLGDGKNTASSSPPPLIPKLDTTPTLAPPPGMTPSTALPKTIPTPSSGQLSLPDQIRNYVDRYAGDCLFLLPVAVSANAAVLEGLTASAARVDEFSAAFRREFNFGPAIGSRIVTEAQCPAVRFLNQLRGDRVRMPRLSLATTEVQNGDTLDGSIENVANRSVELLLVSENGQVRNLSSLLKPGIDVLTFSIGMQASDAAPRPQILMAIASGSAVDALKIPGSIDADQFFPKIFADPRLAGMNMTATARHFRLGR